MQILKHLCLMTLIASGCAHDADPSQTRRSASVRDSAGVRIVLSDSPAWGKQQWFVDTSNVVIIGVEEGDEPYLLQDVMGAAVLSDGRIAIADGQSAEIRLFNGNGQHVITVGGRGNGPGEFQHISHLSKGNGDTLIVWEAGLRPRSYLSPEGGFVRRVPIDHSAVMAGLTWRLATEVLTPLNTGSFVIHATLRNSEPNIPDNGSYRPLRGFYLFDPSTNAIDSLGWYAGGWTRLAATIGGRRMTTPAISPARVRVAASWDGTRIYIGDGDRWNIDAYEDGQLTTAIRRTADPMPFPDSLYDHAKRARIEMSPPHRRADEKRVLDAAPRQTHFPAFYELAVDSLGYLWAQGSDGLQVFDATGQWLGTVGGVRGQILSIGEGYVVALRRDSNMIEHVAKYSLHRDLTSRCC